MREPGIEPGSPIWQTGILTAILLTLLMIYFLCIFKLATSNTKSSSKPFHKSRQYYKLSRAIFLSNSVNAK